MSTRLKTFEDVWKVRVDATAKADKENCIDKHIVNNNKSEIVYLQEDLKKEKNNNLLNDKNRAYLEKLGDKYRALEVQNGVGDIDSVKRKEEEKQIFSSKITQDQKTDKVEKSNNSNQTSRSDCDAKHNQKRNKEEQHSEEIEITPQQSLKPQHLLIDPIAEIFAKKINSLPNEYECTFSPISRVHEQGHDLKEDDKLQRKIREHQRIEREPILQQQHKNYEDEKEVFPEDNEDSQNKQRRGQYEEDSLQHRSLVRTIKDKQEHDKFQFNLQNDYQSQNQQQHSASRQSDKDEEEQLVIDTTKQNRLYEDAKVRKNKQQVIEKIVSEHRKQQTNSSKMTPASQKIVLKKIEVFLGELVSKVSDEFNKVSFEAVGEVLGHLGILKHLKYVNGEAIINESELSELPPVILSRMKEEMGLHETIWIALATAASSDIEGDIDLRELLSVPSILLFNMLLILLELKLTFQQANLLILQILNTNSSQDHSASSSSSSPGLSLSSKLVTQFRKLFDDRTILMETYSHNKKDFAQDNSKSLNSQYYSNNSNSEMSFHPVINEKSRNIDNSIISNETLSGAPRHELLFQQYKIRLEKQVQYNAEKKSNEVAGCTFKPAINPTKKKISLQDEGEQSSDGKKSDKAEQKKKHHERLFELASRKQEEIREIKEHLEFSKHEKEIQECTFKPKTSDSRYHPLQNQGSEGRLQQQVKGTETQLMRMEKARRDKQDKEQFFIKQQEALRDKNSKIQHKVMPFSFDVQDNSNKTNLKGMESNGYDENNSRIHNTAEDEKQTKYYSKQQKNSQISPHHRTPQSPKNNGRQIERDTVKQRGYSSLGFQREHKQNGHAENNLKSNKVTADDYASKLSNPNYNNIPISRAQTSKNAQPKTNKNINNFNTNLEQKKNLHEQIEKRTISASITTENTGYEKQKKTPTKVLPLEKNNSSTTEAVTITKSLKEKKDQAFDHSKQQLNQNPRQQIESQPQSMPRRLLGHVDVNITKNKKAKVILHEGDNAEELAQNFARVYGIAPDVTETLSELLKTYILQFSKKPK